MPAKPSSQPSPQCLIDLRVLRAEILGHLEQRGLTAHVGPDPIGAADATPDAMSLAANGALTAMRKALGENLGDVFDVRMALGEFRSACFWSMRRSRDVDRRVLEACLACRRWMSPGALVAFHERHSRAPDPQTSQSSRSEEGDE